MKKPRKLKKPTNGARPLGEPPSRKAKKAVGHDKRVSAISRRGKASAVPPAAEPPVSTSTRTVADRVNKRRPAFDGTPNYSEEGQAQESSPALADSPIEIDPTLAADQLRELAELHSDVRRAQRNADDKAESAKTAKKTVESKTSLLLEKLRMFTHKPSLPLFDAVQHDRDVTRMLDADKEAAAAATGEGMPEGEEAGELPLGDGTSPVETISEAAQL